MKRSGFWRRVGYGGIGVLLLPVVAAELWAIVLLLSSSRITPELLAFSVGFAFWIVLFHSLPRPFRAYVLAHELSHAVWGFFTGSAVSDLRVSRRGGSVRLSEAGLFGTLAPYFLPLYTVLLLLTYGVASLFWNPESGRILWMAALGASWGFHISFTAAILLETPQPDLREYGRFFSLTLILVLHFAILFAALAILLSASGANVAHALTSAFASVWNRIAGLGGRFY